MGEAFVELDKLIMITAAEACATSYPEKHYTDLSEKIIAACKNARDKIVNTGFCVTSQGAFDLFIRNCQHTFTHLLDTIYTRRAAGDGASLTDLYNRAEEALEDLYYLLKKRYVEFFLVDAPIPRRLLAACREELRQELPGLKQQVKQWFPGSELPLIAFGPVEQLLNDDVLHPVTWRMRQYQQHLLLLLDGWVRGKRSVHENPEWDFIVLLIKAGLNTDAAYEYCRAYLCGIIDGSEGLEKKIQALDKLLCGVQLAAEYGMSFRETMLPLKDYWTQAIQAEGARLEKKWLAEQRREMKGWILIKEKIKSLFNATQECIWVNALMEGGKIEKRPYKQIAAIWAACVETIGQPNLSAGSLEKKSAPSAEYKDWELDGILEVLAGMTRYVLKLKLKRA